MVFLLLPDKSQLLLCGETQKVGVRVDQADLQEILKDNRSPRCLPNKDIMLYTGKDKTYLYYCMCSRFMKILLLSSVWRKHDDDT